jgi:hypothetical protein
LPGPELAVAYNQKAQTLNNFHFVEWAALIHEINGREVVGVFMARGRSWESDMDSVGQKN